MQLATHAGQYAYTWTGSASAIDVARHPWWKPGAGLRLRCCLRWPLASHRRLFTGTVQQKHTQAYYFVTKDVEGRQLISVRNNQEDRVERKFQFANKFGVLEH